jgi:hypothetical protein
MTSILCIGNFGTGKTEQIDVAKLLCQLCCGEECKLILGLGNNIYPDGVSSINDNQFLEKFEIPYSILPNNIKFYNILGNRDYHLKNSVRAQINYHNSEKSFRWIMPYNYYCFIKQFDGVPVEFIAIDTNLEKMKNRVSQEKWAINTLLESRGRWRILFGHHPWKNFGVEGKEKKGSSKLDDLYQKLVDTGKVDLIISGHENSQQHIYIPEKPDMIISGVGGYTHKEDKQDKNAIFLAKELKFRSIEAGCVKIEVKRNELNVGFFNTKNDILYSFKIKKT